MDNRKQREKRKTYSESLKEGFGNKVKETREKVLSDKVIKKEMQEYVKTFFILIQLWIVTKTIVVSLANLNQFFRQFTRICCFLSKLAPQEWFQHLLYLTQTHLLLILLTIAVLEVHAHLQICHWIHRMKRFETFLRNYKAQQIQELKVLNSVDKLVTLYQIMCLT